MKRSICILLTMALLLACGPTNRSWSAADESPPPSAAAETASPSPVPVVTVTLTDTSSLPATAAPAPTAMPVAEPTPTPAPTPEPPFSMAWASDTQIMVSRYREMLSGFTDMCAWIADHAEEKNIVAFLHSGDMVDDPGNRGPWGNFSKGMEVIAAKMPLFVTLGNHDYMDYSPWPAWMEQFFFRNIPEDHAYRGGLASYMELTAGSTDLLFIQLAFREKSNLTAMGWLKSICDAHADWPVIMVVHGYLTNDGRLMNVAKDMERSLVSKCPNIRLILCGHSRGIARQAFTYDDDGDGVKERTVNVLMYDLQMDRERYGYFCLLTFDPVSRTVSVDSYSPFLDDYIYDDENPDAERFTIEDAF